VVLPWCLFGSAPRDQSAIRRPKRIREGRRYKRLGSLGCLAAEDCVRAADMSLALSARQAWRVHRELNSGTGEFASDSPDLPPIPKVALLELPAGGPSTCAIGRANNGTPVGAPVHRRSDADWLAGCASDQNLEAIADLKISANGTARIEETHEWTLGGCRNNSQNQEEWDPHNSPIRVHSNRAMYWPRIPAGSRAAFTGVAVPDGICRLGN